MWDSINTIYEDADRDPELKDWFRAMNRYIRRCLQEQGYIMDDHSNEEWHRLHDHGNYLLREKYRAHTNRIVDEIKFLGDQFEQDPQNKAYGESMNKLFTHLGNDENGKPTFKRHLVKDLTDVIIPAILKNTRYIPLPRIEYSDHKIDAVIDNLVLESDNFMPNVFEISSENYVRWGRKHIANKNKHSAEVTIAGIQMDLRNVSYYIKRKEGFPTLTDTGVANILLGGEGFTSRLRLTSANAADSQNFFKIDKVDVDLKNLKMKLTKSNHKLLFNLFNPIMLRVFRPALKKAAEKAIRDQFDQFDRKLFQIKKEADRVAEEARANPEEAPNIYNRYVSAIQKQFLHGKEKVQPSADKKVNLAVAKDESIFPNIKLPGETSAKATEYKELARKGDRWESPVFSIGNAARSNDIPSTPEIVRKPHAAANGSATAAAPNGPAALNGRVGFAGEPIVKPYPNYGTAGLTGDPRANAVPTYGVADLAGESRVNPTTVNPSGAPVIGADVLGTRIV